MRECSWAVMGCVSVCGDLLKDSDVCSAFLISAPQPDDLKMKKKEYGATELTPTSSQRDMSTCSETDMSILLSHGVDPNGGMKKYCGLCPLR